MLTKLFVGNLSYKTTEEDIIDLFKREVTGIDHIIEKASAGASYSRELIPLNAGIRINPVTGLLIKLSNVDRTQIARIVEVQLLFTTWVTRVYWSH